jgi:trehalose 6-phosphate phosphatase
VAFLHEHLVPGVELVGQYGVEHWAYGGVVVDARVEPYLDAVAAAAAEAEAMWPALLVERKGDVAVTVHWRAAPGHQPAPGALEELAARHGLTMLDARMAAELRPPVPLDKGTALEMLLADAGAAPGHDDAAFSHVAYVGDDRGDLAVFDAIERDLDYESGEMEAMRIAVRSAEAPPELLDRADVVIDGPAGVADFLTAWAAVA